MVKYVRQCFSDGDESVDEALVMKKFKVGAVGGVGQSDDSTQSHRLIATRDEVHRPK
jgi:hypothetical protein